MTLEAAVTVLFDCGLELLEENARDLAKQDDGYEGAIAEHPKVVACEEAIAVLRAAKVVAAGKCQVCVDVGILPSEAIACYAHSVLYLRDRRASMFAETDEILAWLDARRRNRPNDTYGHRLQTCIDIITEQQEALVEQGVVMVEKR